MPSRLQTDPKRFIRWFSIEGCVAVIVILVAIVQSVLTLVGVIPVDTEKVIAANVAILSVLAALSAASLVRLANQARAMEDLAEQTKRKDLPVLVLKQKRDRPSLETLLEGAKCVLICDAFLSSIQPPQHLLVQLLQNRCDVSVVVLNPKNEDLLAATSALSSLEPLDSLRHVLEGAIKNITAVARVYSRGQGDDNDANGELQLRYFDSFMPLAGALVQGAREKDSRVLVELYPFKYDELKICRHHFVLEKEHTPDLFETYEQTLKQVFRASKPQILPSDASCVETPRGAA